MNIKAEVLAEERAEIPQKNGKKVLHLLNCLDRSEGPRRLGTTFDYVMTDDEFEKVNGRMAGTLADLGISKIGYNEYEARLRMEGTIISCAAMKEGAKR